MTYATTKTFLLSRYEEGFSTHVISAVAASFTTTTATNPIWLVKTRMQLGTNRKNSVVNIAYSIYQRDGWRGFYRGMTASYMGASETVIQFVIYERLKLLASNAGYLKHDSWDASEVLAYLGTASAAKLLASSMTYPHEVARTRLREELSHVRYKGLVHCLRTVWKEEGRAGLYAGMGTHLLRVVPNTAIMFFVYEAMIRSVLA
jgi:solute carrier family 25, member 33/36